MRKLLVNIPENTGAANTSEHANRVYMDSDLIVKNCNCCNNSRVVNLDVPKEDKDKIIALEDNLRFLRSEHSTMLNKLHEEVDELRRTNKDLQFRLVMCCCSKETQNSREKSCVRSIEDINEEVDDLRRVISEERLKSQYLLQQLEALKEAQRSVIDRKDLLGIPVERTSIGGGENVRNESSAIPQSGSVVQNESLTKDSAMASTIPEKTKSETTIARENGSPRAIPHAKTSVKKRITSPDLNQDSQSSAILLTPNTSMPTPDGFWVRPSVAGLKNTTLPTGTRESMVLNKHIMPVKLPIVHEPDGPSYAGRPSKELLTAKLPGQDVTPDKNSSSFVQINRLDKQNRLVSSAHSARNTLGHNTIANYDISALRVPKMKSYSRSTGFIASSFLPDISKSIGPERSANQPHGKVPHEAPRRRSTRINTHTQLPNK